MLILFAEIPAAGLQLDIRDASWFPDNEFNRIGDPVVQVTIFRNEERVNMEGDLAVSLRVECDRCLQQFEFPLQTHFRIGFEVISDHERESFPDEYGCSMEELETVFLENQAIPVFDMLRQQLYLALPAKKICSSSCRGLCACCGSDLNVKTCSCDQQAVGLPFRGLAAFKVTAK